MVAFRFFFRLLDAGRDGRDLAEIEGDADGEEADVWVTRGGDARDVRAVGVAAEEIQVFEERRDLLGLQAADVLLQR
jgi:hypothetical protein